MTDESIYPVTECVEYQDDVSYRDILMRVILLTNGPCPENTPEPDVFEHFLNRVFDATNYNEILHQFYMDSAAFMISEDPGIGLAVLCSFDYFALFHKVLCDYFSADATHPFTMETPSVVSLRAKMTR
jgi:hypothetical protein